MIYRIEVPAQMQTLPAMAAVANKVRCEPSEVARTEMKFRVPEKMPMLHEIARFSVLDIQGSQSQSGITAKKSDQPIYANGLFLTRDGLLKVLYERRGRPYEGAGAVVWSIDSHKLIQSRDTRDLAYLSPLHEDWLASSREGNVLDILGGHVITNIKEGSGENYSYAILGVDSDTGDVYRVAGKSIEHYAANGKRLKDISRAGKKVLSLSARNGRLAILYADYTGEILQVNAGGENKAFGPLNKEGNCDIGGILLSADGRYIQAGFDCGDGGDMYWLLDTHTGKWSASRFFIAPLPAHVARAVVRGERRYQLAIMDLEKSAIFARLPPHLGNDKEVLSWQLSSAISDDGRFVASGSNDGTIYVWDIDTGTMLGMAKTGSNVNKMVFDLTRRQIAAALDNGNIVVFEIQNKRG
jgi:WD40 repeat protein